MRFWLLLVGMGTLLFAWRMAAGPLAQFRTVLGEVDVELFDSDKPETVQNFLRYVQSGAYTDTIIHRWEANFVIQGGGVRTVFPHTTNATFVPVLTAPAITNEYSVGRTFSNQFGTIAMARQAGNTNSATSQWFFNLKDNSDLDSVDGGFTVFGKVVSGTNVLNRFNSTASTNGIYRLVGLADPLSELPVLSRDITADNIFDNVIYVDISVLNMQVHPASSGAYEISWTSVSNKVNRVEYTSQMPPVWEQLISTNGTGQSLQIIDNSPAAGSRFYRVRIEY